MQRYVSNNKKINRIEINNANNNYNNTELCLPSKALRNAGEYVELSCYSNNKMNCK